MFFLIKRIRAHLGHDKYSAETFDRLYTLHACRGPALGCQCNYVRRCNCNRVIGLVRLSIFRWFKMV